VGGDEFFVVVFCSAVLPERLSKIKSVAFSCGTLFVETDVALFAVKVDQDGAKRLWIRQLERSHSRVWRGELFVSLRNVVTRH